MVSPEQIILPEALRIRSRAKDHLQRKEVLRQRAPEFWKAFIVNNLPLIVCGDLHRYSRQLAVKHQTHPVHDHPARSNQTPLPEIIAQLENLDNLLGVNETAAISHTFGLSSTLGLSPEEYDESQPWDGSLSPFSYLHTALIGIDFEPPPNDSFLSCLIESFDRLKIPVIIFHTGGGYFATCLEKAYLDDFSLLRDYGKIAEEVVGRFEPDKLGWAKKMALDDLKDCRRRSDLDGLTWCIEECFGHWGEPNSLCVDLRHLKNSLLANSLRRGKKPYVPGDPFLTIQMYFRIGEKRGNDIPYIVYSSEQIPLTIGQTIPFAG